MVLLSQARACPPARLARQGDAFLPQLPRHRNWKIELTDHHSHITMQALPVLASG